MLTKMAEKKLAPNLETLNTTMDCFKSMYTWRKSTNICLQILKEFENLGVQPSLATYYHLIKVFNKDRKCQKCKFKFKPCKMLCLAIY